MKLVQTCSIAALSLAALVAAKATESDPLFRSAADVKWGAPPPVLPPGVKFAVINGDPSKAGNVTIRLDMPAGYVIPPHTHPTDEHVTVLGGDFSIGMGDTVDRKQSLHLRTGGYGVAIAGMHHYAYTTHGAIVQVHMQGPFAISYVNPKDDPSHPAASAVH